MNIKTKLRNYLISGTLIIVPAAISVWILWKIFIFLEGFIGQWLQKTIPNLYVKGLGLVSLIVLIFILGFLAHNVFGKRILRYIEKIFLAVPVLNKLYNFVHSILEQIFRKEKLVFYGVALIQLSEQITTIGFITSKQALTEDMGNDYWTVYIPTVPTPTGGFILTVHKDKLKVLPISVEAGMKLILSFGIYDISNATDQSQSNNLEKN